MESGNGDTVSVGDNIRRLAKKVRRRPEEPLDLDDPVVNDKRMKLDSINVRTVSSKDKLLNTTIERINFKNEEDIELLEGDEKKKIVDGIPSITFFERDDDKYLYAVSGRPWTIFGQYLTVQL
ncbi:hypothetical protein Goari_004466 [Gossypium aridum]|uniref:Uncharacterized protein n=1 Tax=Gossypium aridum TaxID=34290 RepID=A0A7J8Y3K6_GOSAI|nr:hypothetical protein [Gossypium aridum]